MNSSFVITIDGPAASGKSSVAREVARRLVVPFVSSGQLYRGHAWLVREAGLTEAGEAEVLAELERHEVGLKPGLHGNLLMLDGTARYAELHTDEIHPPVSRTASFPSVREWANRRLRELTGSFVGEGRDMGTAVFPSARFKFWLDAPVEVRAARRQGERQAGLEILTEQLARRDRLDARQLVPAADALSIDTGSLDVAGVADIIMGRVQEEL